VVDAQGRRLSGGGLDRWLVRVAPPGARGTVAVALVSDARMRGLNRRYRANDYVTDVLSFRSAEAPRPARLIRFSPDAPERPKIGRSGPPSCLGDIVIATGMARRQARAAGHSERTELRILALHGLLHLIGYDHEVDAGAMARMERRLRRKGGLREGLIERDSA
jgi:probable rRNA maturation factor